MTMPRHRPKTSRPKDGPPGRRRNAPATSPAPPGFIQVHTHDLPWRRSTAAAGVFIRDIASADGWAMQVVDCEPGAHFTIHTHAGPEFLYILQGELVQAGRSLGPGCASVARAGSVDDDVHTEVGCVFVLVEGPPLRRRRPRA